MSLRFERELKPDYEEVWNAMLGGTAAGIGNPQTANGTAKKIFYFIPTLIYFPFALMLCMARFRIQTFPFTVLVPLLISLVLTVVIKKVIRVQNTVVRGVLQIILPILFLMILVLILQ